MKFILLFIALVLLVVADETPSFALEMKGWSFEKYPQPTIAEFRPKEILASLALHERIKDLKLLCRRMLDLEFSIYLSRYPEYLSAFDEREQVKEWRRHIALYPPVQSVSCLYQVIQDELDALNSSPDIGEDFIFCGIYSREPRNKTERRVKEILDELISYAQSGAKKAISIYRSSSDRYNIMERKDDVDYYFTLLQKEEIETDVFLEHVAFFKRVIEPDRLAFIRKAAQKRDYQAVLDTMARCRPEQKPIWRRDVEGWTSQE